MVSTAEDRIAVSRAVAVVAAVFLAMLKYP
jgi:hypothetical protein